MICKYIVSCLQAVHSSLVLPYQQTLLVSLHKLRQPQQQSCAVSACHSALLGRPPDLPAAVHAGPAVHAAAAGCAAAGSNWRWPAAGWPQLPAAPVYTSEAEYSQLQVLGLVALFLLGLQAWC